MWGSEIVRRIDSRAEFKLVTRFQPPEAIRGAVSGGTKWLAKFLAHGGAQSVDVIGFHFYVDPRPPEAMLPLIRFLNEPIVRARRTKERQDHFFI